MGVKHALIFLSLGLQVLCDQKNSLTFVIDDTSSMWDDIKQVKSAAKSIIDIVLKEKSSQIEDIVVVTFNDPTFKFRHRTRDEQELKQTLDRITVHDGGDCPEKSLSGIKLALEESQPGSYLFVFTDASAKDFSMFDEIKNLCQEKQSQIVFVLTGDCGTSYSINMQVYYKIAAASNGQVFRISKGEVGQVLEYVKETIKGDKTVITSKVVPPNREWATVFFNIDERTEYALVSASGTNVEMIVRNRVDREVRGTMVTWTQNVKVMKLFNLRPGDYKVLVRGTSNVNVMVFGRTDFNFKFGFSDKVENSLKYTEAQPIEGTETHLIIDVKDDKRSVNIQNVEIMDMKENVLRVLPLTNVGGNVYATPKFIPPSSMFKVAVTATAHSTGKLIRRIANTPVAPIKPVVVAPEISDTEKLFKAKEGDMVNIHCRIRKGKPKPQVAWYFKPQSASDFHLLRDVTDDVVRIRSVTGGHAGHYQCLATNSAGQATHVVQLDVIGPPAFEESLSVLQVKQSEVININCKLSKGNPPPKVTWQFSNSAKEGYRSIDNSGEHLIIVNAQLSNSGFYRCQARNDMGTAEHVTQVVVVAPPEIETNAPSILRVKEHDTTSILCRITSGYPKPVLTWWYKKDNSHEYLRILTTEEHLRLENVPLAAAGHYKCIAQNTVGRAEKNVQVFVEVVSVPPVLERSPSVIEVRQSTNVAIPCKVLGGNPSPTITWQFRSSETESYHDINKFEENLLISNVQISNSGFYRCQAKNHAGVAEQVAQVFVVAPPEIERDASTIVKVRENASTTIPCRITEGIPKPTLSWWYKNNNSDKYVQIPNTEEYLRLENVQMSNAGSYKCIATNTAGQREKNSQVIVEVPPAFENMPSVVEVRRSSDVDIHCKVSKGNPTPEVTWYYRSSEKEAFRNVPNIGEHFKIVDVQLSNAGFYMCQAKNDAGNTQHNTQLVVFAPPETDKDAPSVIRVKENSTADITCGISGGFPVPTVSWWYKNASTGRYKQLRDNDKLLNLRNVQLSDAGTYICTAENNVGDAEKYIEVIVEAPARIVFIPPNKPSYEGVEGDAVMRLPCTAVGFPAPTVSWSVGRVIVGKDKSSASYVEDGVLYVKNPKPTDSSNAEHTYMCHAANEFGKDKHLYQVVVTKYTNYNNSDQKYGEIKKPYELKCPLPFTDPNSVRWFYNSVDFNKSGPSLHFDVPTEANNGNYTCRVSDFTGATSYTVELQFGYPPRASRLVHDEDWDGEEDEISCKAEQSPDGKYEWFYRGEKVKEADDAQELELSLIGWGQYVCRVTNALGSLNITFNIHAHDCMIERNLSRTKNLPLVLDMSMAWPRFSRRRQYEIVHKSDKLTFICQDDSPKVESKVPTSRNAFVKFPKQKSITATCDDEGLFQVDGGHYQFSELDCKEGLLPKVVETKECLGSDTMLMRIGFNVNGFLDVYKSCLDTKRNVVLYTEVTMPRTDIMGYSDETEGSCKIEGDCCYETVQFVQAADVNAGPAEKAVLREPLNTVSYCRPNNKNVTSWHDIERHVRQMAAQSRVTVWSGAANYVLVGKRLVPQHLWKVVKSVRSKEILVIVHSNEQTPSGSLCENVCHESWFEPYGPRTYCCKLDEFKRVFDLPLKF